MIIYRNIYATKKSAVFGVIKKKKVTISRYLISLVIFNQTPFLLVLIFSWVVKLLVAT